MYPNSVKKLIDSFKCLPGIGNKTAERLAFSMIDFDKEILSTFSNAIIDVRDKICKCKECGNISDGEICSICLNESRDKRLVFVVEKAKDIILFEKLGIFKGIYHVLDGLISPIDGIGPDDIEIKKLVSPKAAGFNVKKEDNKTINGKVVLNITRDDFEKIGINVTYVYKDVYYNDKYLEDKISNRK